MAERGFREPLGLSKLSVSQGKLFSFPQGDTGKALAGKSTLNRLELTPEFKNRYQKIVHHPEKIENAFIDFFLDAHDQAPKSIVIDFDATDDLIHGNQEGRFYHGYYGNYCYLPLYIFCGDFILAAKLRPSNIDACEGTTVGTFCRPHQHGNHAGQSIAIMVFFHRLCAHE